MPGALLPSRMRQTLPSGGSEAPPPDVGFFEGIGAAFRSAEDRQDLMTQAPRNADAYRDLLDSLGDMGVDTSRNGALYMDVQDSMGFTRRIMDREAIIKEVNRRKAQNTAHFTKVPATREEFDMAVANRFGESQRDEERASAAGFVPSLIGGAASAMTDPINLATMPVGGGTTFWRTVLIGGIVSGMTEAALLPDTKRAMDRMGRDFTTADAVQQVGYAAVGGAVFDGIGYGVAKNWDAIKVAPKAVQEKLWAKIAPSLPESIRPKMDWDAIGDDMLPDIAEAVIGRDNLSEAEADAVAVVRRESAIEARNPFQPDGAGTRVHAENLAEAMQRIFDAPTPSGFGAQARAAVSRGNRETLNRSTSISSGVVPGDARSVLKSRIKVVESSGSNVARNPNSTALGPYQFLTGTWSRLYKSRYGASGKSDAEIAALRTDPRLNEILMDDLMALNEQSLRSAGITPNAGNLYLAHFAGNSGARKLHRVPPNTPVRDVLGDAVVEANPFLQGMNAADVIDWAARKMGGQGGVPSSGRSVDIDPEAAVRADLDRQRAQIDADRAAIEGIAPRPRLIDDDDMLPEPIHDGGDIPVLANPIEAIARPAPIAAPAVPPRLPTIEDAEVSAFLPELRKIVRAREMSLNEPAKMAAALGVDEALLRRGLIQMAAGKEIRMNKKQQFMRLPQDSGPVDVLKYIARAGGIKDSEGHDLTGMFRVVQTRSRKVGKGALMEVRRHKVDTTYLVPGAGYIVSDKGRSVDEIGELLWEAGYINNGGDRPTVREVLDMLDSAFRGGKKFYPVDEYPVDEVATARIKTGKLFRSEEEEYYIRNMFDEVAQANGYSVDDADFAIAARILLTEDVDTMDDAVLLMVNRELQDIQAAAFYEVKEDYYASIEDRFAKAWAENAGIDDAAFNRRQADAGNAGARGADAPDVGGQSRADGQDELEPPYLDQGALRAFDDPEGPAAMGVVDSLEHDLRAVLDPAIAERQAQQAQLKAASPMQAKVDQESTMGSPLFDAVDQPTFRLDDEGDPVAPADLLAEIDAEDAMIKNIKDCL
jgi:hypothetical protein